MIAKLRGLLDSTGEDWAIIDVGGVGYLAYCPGRTLSRLPAPGGLVHLFIETHVREDHIHLYGFVEDAERAWFRLLLTVQGVGAKVALALLTALSADELGRAIAAGYKVMLARAQGVGAKLAARLTVELKDKAPLIAPSFAALGARPAADPGVPDTVEDAVSALSNLGYRRLDAQSAVLKALATLGPAATSAALIRAGLRDLGRELTR